MLLPRRVCLLPGMLGLAWRFMRADDQAKGNIETRGSEETVYDLGPGITPPRLVHQVRPERGDTPGFRLKGKVVIALVVTSAGQPSKLKVIESLDNEVDHSALQAVEQWRFVPARKDGKAVAVRVTVEISFNDI